MILNPALRASAAEAAIARVTSAMSCKVISRGGA
jgi:hypothetical protein